MDEEKYRSRIVKSSIEVYRELRWLGEQTQDPNVE